MMRSIPAGLFWILFGAAALFSCGRDRGNPFDHSGGGYILKGTVFTNRSPYWSGPVHLTGNGVNRTVFPDPYGMFSLSGLGAGTYTISVPGGNCRVIPDSAEVTVPGDEVRTVDFAAMDPGSYDSLLQNSTIMVFGRITSPDGKPVAGVQVGEERTNTGGIYFFETTPGFMYRLAPFKPNYSYRFNPENVDITPGQPVVIANFTASYSGPPLRSITGRCLLRNGTPGSRTVVHAINEEEILATIPDSLGWFHFYGLHEGTWTITVTGRYTWEPEKAVVTLKGSDKRVPDFIGAYTGPTDYRIYGKVVDENGNGMPDVSIGQEKTIQNGRFFLEVLVEKPHPKQAITFIPRQPGYTFLPESASVALEWNESALDAVTIFIPDFVGSTSR